MKRRYWQIIGVLTSGAIATALFIVRQPNNMQLPDGTPEEDIKAGLTLRDVTLEQQNDDGQLLWKVSAEEVTYSPDKESANLVRPNGELFQDGKVIYRVKAERGIVQRNGQSIFLEENIHAEGLENKMILKGQQLQWLPEESLLIIKNGLMGTHPEIRAQANEARVFNRESRMELSGKVIANTVFENPQEQPWLKLQGEKIDWNWEKEIITSTVPIQIERFQREKITEVLSGNKVQLELAQKRATFTEGVKAKLLSFPLEMISEQAVWDVEKQTIATNKPIQVTDPKQGIIANGQTGLLDLAQKVVFFKQNVKVVSQKNDSQLTTDQLTWNLSDSTVLAEGAVYYRQQNPQVTVTGQRAQGRINEQTVVVEGAGGNSRQQVVTEIVPN
jgi:LPS export ABC transporter protein LptC